MTIDNFERIAGAKECIQALIKLEHSANNLPDEADDASVYLACQSDDAEKLIAQFGPLTSRQEGAFRVLAEFIHFGATTGWPDLGCWTPFVANTGAEKTAWVAEIDQ